MHRTTELLVLLSVVLIDEATPVPFGGVVNGVERIVLVKVDHDVLLM